MLCRAVPCYTFLYVELFGVQCDIQTDRQAGSSGDDWFLEIVLLKLKLGGKLCSSQVCVLF